MHPATGREQREIMEKFPLGTVLSCDLERFRSHAQNRTFFGFLSFIWETTGAQDQFHSPVDMRAQLFVEAGYKTSHRFKFPMDAETFRSALAALVIQEKAKGKPLIYNSTPDGDVVVNIPKSWEFPDGKKGLAHPDAVALMNACLEILCTKYVPGLNPDEMMAAYKLTLASNKLGKRGR